MVKGLYEKYPDIASLAAASPEEIEKIIRPCGLGKSKARDICACMRMLHEQYNDKVPDSIEELLKLPELEGRVPILLWVMCSESRQLLQIHTV